MKEKILKKGFGRRLFSFILALAMAVSLMPAMPAERVKAAEGDDEIIFVPIYSDAKMERVNITKSETSTLNVGTYPNSATMDSNGIIYVSNRGSGTGSRTISVIDSSDFSLKDTISLNYTGEIYGLTIDPTMENLYIGSQNGIIIYHLEDGAQNKILTGKQIYYCSVTEDYLYAQVINSNEFIKYDLTTNASHSVNLMYKGYLGNLSPNGQKYVVSTQTYSNKTMIIDTDTMQLVSTIDSQSYYSDYSKDGTYIYLLDQLGNFKVYNADSLALVSSVNLECTENYSMGVSSDGNSVYAISYLNSVLKVIDISDINNISVRGSIALSGMPYVAGPFMPSTYLQTKIDELKSHSHNFTYSVPVDAKDTIVATCANTDGNCSLDDGTESHGHSVTLILSAEDKNYSGSVYTGVSITSTNFATITGATVGNISYYKKGSNSPLAGAPTDAGEYTAKVVVTDSSSNEYAVFKDFEIGKVAPGVGNFTYTAPTNLDYDGNAKSATVNAKTGVTGLGDITVKYYLGDVEVTEPKDVGTYTVKVSVTEGTNYNAITTPITVGTFTITKATTYDGTKTASGSLHAKNGKTVEITLPTLPSGAGYGTVVNSNTSFFTVGAVSNGKVTVTSAKDWDKSAENTAKTFTIPVTGATNYNDYVVTVTITPTFHTHDFSFAVTGNTIVATCSEGDCDLEEKQALLTLTASNPTYGDSEIEPTITYGSQAEQTVWTNEAELVIPETETTDPNAPVVTKKYFKADASGNNKVGSALESAPTDAGKYIVEVTISYGNNPDKTVTVSLSYAIKKQADLSATPIGGQGKITIEGMDPDQEYIITTESDPTKLTDGDWENPVGPDGVVTGLPDGAGPYYVYTRTKADENHPTGTAGQMGPCYTNVPRPYDNRTGYTINPNNTITIDDSEIEVFSDKDCTQSVEPGVTELLPGTTYYVRRRASGNNGASEPFAFKLGEEVAPTGLGTVPDTGSVSGTPNGKVTGVTPGMEYSYGEDTDGDGEIDWIPINDGTEITGLPNGKILVRFKGTDYPNVYTTLWIGGASSPSRGNGGNGHTHVYEWGSWGQVSKDEDGTQVYQCVICGDVLEKELIPAYAYTCLTESERVLKTPQNGSVICDMGRWNAYPRWFFEKLATRPDVNITLKFLYQHKQYTVSIPAGTKIDTECDWYGPMKICSLYKFEVK